MTVAFHYAPGRLQDINLDGRWLFNGTGGLYLIGSTRPGAPDDSGSHVSGEGTHLSNGGAPYSLTFQQLDARTLQIDATVGPLPVPYTSLSLPMDCSRAVFDSWATDGSRHSVGCARTWATRAGAAGRFVDIPTPCEIPGVGHVGLAWVDTPKWAEIRGPHCTIRRVFTPLPDDKPDQHRGVQFANHPGTYNSEVCFSRDPGFAEPVPAGRTIVHREWLIVVPVGADPLPPPGPAPAPGTPWLIRIGGTVGGRWWHDQHGQWWETSKRRWDEDSGQPDVWPDEDAPAPDPTTPGQGLTVTMPGFSIPDGGGSAPITITGRRS